MSRPRLAEAVLADGRKIPYVITENPPQGGMKYTYFAPDKSYVVQYFLDPDAVDEALVDRLTAIIGRYNPTLAETKGGARGNTVEAATYFADLFCWPTAIVTKPEFGIVCPAYPKNFFFGRDASRQLDLAGKDKKGSWFTNRVRKYLEKSELGNFQMMLRLSIALARAVRRMHQAGLAHSDLSCNNVLVDPKSGSCVVIDIDSLVVPGLYPPEVAGTKGYIAPEVLASMDLPPGDARRVIPSLLTDLFALPVLLYQYLLKRHPLEGPKNYDLPAEEADFLIYGEKALFAEHPTDHSNRPDDLKVTIHDLGPYLEKLFLRAFVDGLHEPEARPTAFEWEKALVKTWDLLQPCANPHCPEKFFILHDTAAPRCPFCGTAVPERRVLHLKRLRRVRGKAGQWLKAGLVNVYDGLPLFSWHFTENVFPDEKAHDREVKAYITRQNGAWHLVNSSLSSLRTPEGELLPKGKALSLRSGEPFGTWEQPDGVLYIAERK